MIPEFPIFKPLELSDREDVMRYTSQFLPYSDFNFVSMWSWDIDGKIMISELVGNLVINFSDYVTSEPFYSMLGSKDMEESIKSLIKVGDKRGMGTRLKLIPEDVANLVKNKDGISVEEDRDNFDYIFSIENLATMAGAKLAAKRNYIRRFLKDHESTYGILDATQESTKKNVIGLCEDWARHKHVSDEELDHEIRAIERYFSMENYENHIILGIWVQGELIAFWAIEILSKDFAISHFQKAKLGLFRGIYPYLNQIGAQIIAKKGISYINFEQDLGLSGLREGKMDYGPVSYLKKFIINPK